MTRAAIAPRTAPLGPNMHGLSGHRRDPHHGDIFVDRAIGRNFRVPNARTAAARTDDARDLLLP